MPLRHLSMLLLPGLLALSVLVPHGATAQTQLWTQPTVQTTRTLADLKGGGPFGLGFSAGSRNGMTMKIWAARAHAIVIDVGAPPFPGSLALGFGYRGHFKPLAPPSNAIAALPFIGINGRVRMMFTGGSTPFVEAGPGVMFGVSVVVPQWPVELFFEAGPVFAFWDAGDGVGFAIDVDGLAGARLFF
jgi:hypothetical protein